MLSKHRPITILWYAEAKVNYLYVCNAVVYLSLAVVTYSAIECAIKWTNNKQASNIKRSFYLHKSTNLRNPHQGPAANY